MKNLLFALITTLLLVTACSTMTTVEKENKRTELDAMAMKAIGELKEADPGLQDELDKSRGYAVANMKITKVPIVGAGGGEGVLVIKEPPQRVYFTVGRFDVGGGWGARSHKVLMTFDSQEILDKWKDGKWLFEAGAEATAGTAALDGSTGALNKGFTVHMQTDIGASATVTARVIKINVNKKLTEAP